MSKCFCWCVVGTFFMIWLSYSKLNIRRWWKYTWTNITYNWSCSNYSFSNFKYTGAHCNFHQFWNTIFANINTIKESIHSCKWFNFFSDKFNVTRSHEWNEISAYHSVSNRFSIKLFCNNSSRSSSWSCTKFPSCYKIFFYNIIYNCSCCPDYRIACASDDLIWFILNDSLSGRLNRFNTSPISFPGIPYYRTKSSLWINDSIFNHITESFSIVTFSFYYLSFKSCSVNPIICCRG